MTRLGLWISIGVGLGVAVGVALGNISLGVAIGPAIGVMIWAIESAGRKNRPPDDSDDADGPRSD